MFPPTPPSAGTTAAVTNRSGTISVKTTEYGLPVELRIDPRELRYGGQRLADEILTLCRRSAAEAGARRRDELAYDGMPAQLLDKLGLPTRADVAAAQVIEDVEEPTPTSWMRQV
ncbi:hypothetical protein BFN03_04140 [Rhodococcus sp. WMMA185]|uniref:hypothetical protein n=1 Tax=Rhodococcus sp. WMMA185 TaxID=679318 RepID=UPI0008780E85|nr:hypothetical protein [Rhodococcus sp. WMMA185]AOW92171.1 hypothetical protein BFN03_04140 [Rhodococcus sp. WMMA185]